MHRILIVDDEPNICEGLKAALSHKDYEIWTARDGQGALDLLARQNVDLVISDIKMPRMDGLTLQQEVQKLYPGQTMILLTAYGSVETAVEAMRRGAYDFLTKPINLDKFEMVVERALKSKDLDEENRRLREELEKAKGLGDLIGRSKIMVDLFERIKTIAETRSTVLIYGESGTGKELIASAVHRLSPRRDRSFITVNCAALAENLIESELFGHEKGSFTGAIVKKDGRFKLADGGTLFLDEVGELPPHTQVKLLRALQERTFEPVGANYSVSVDVRIIAATNQNLEDLVKKGTFREDLYYRLNVIRLDAPPLKDRTEDIPVLASHFLHEYCREMGKKPKTLAPTAIKALNRYPWPGNVRELRNIIENLVVFSRSQVISIEEIPDHILRTVSSGSTNREPTINLLENEKRLILKALEESKYNKTTAAHRLGMSRRTIHRKIKEYGLEA